VGRVLLGLLVSIKSPSCSIRIDTKPTPTTSSALLPCIAEASDFGNRGLFTRRRRSSFRQDRSEVVHRVDIVNVVNISRNHAIPRRETSRLGRQGAQRCLDARLPLPSSKIFAS